MAAVDMKFVKFQVPKEGEGGFSGAHQGALTLGGVSLEWGERRGSLAD